jgi:hypothetical protein
MSGKAKARLLAFGIGCLLGALALSNAGCGMVAGIGRDLTAMADGLAGDSSANAAAIRGKDGE